MKNCSELAQWRQQRQGAVFFCVSYLCFPVMRISECVSRKTIIWAVFWARKKPMQLRVFRGVRMSNGKMYKNIIRKKGNAPGASGGNATGSGGLVIVLMAIAVGNSTEWLLRNKTDEKCLVKPEKGTELAVAFIDRSISVTWSLSFVRRCCWRRGSLRSSCRHEQMETTPPLLLAMSRYWGRSYLGRGRNARWGG